MESFPRPLGRFLSGSPVSPWLLAAALGGLAVPLLAEEADSSSDDGIERAAEAHRSYLARLREDEKFPSAVTCAQCHPDHYREWSVSPHAYAMLSPVFNAMHMFTTDRLSGTQGDFCIRCHSPVAMQRSEPLHQSVLLRPGVSTEGVTCITCHRLPSGFGHVSGRLPVEEGNIFSTIYGPTGDENLRQALTNPEFGLVTSEDETGKEVHADVEELLSLRSSGFCGSCHDVTSPNGFRLESAFTEFKNSPSSRKGESCQDCHMSVEPGTVVQGAARWGPGGRDLNYRWEPAAEVRNSPRDMREGMPTPPRRRTNHMFIGPDYSIVHPGLFPHSLEARELTYGMRFSKKVTDEITAFLRESGEEDPPEEKLDRMRTRAEELAEQTARKHALTDWLKFRWWEGWGTPAFEVDLPKERRARILAGTGFPWEDPEEPGEAQLRRQAARLVLNHQFNLLNEAHVARVKLLRRALQIEKLEFQRNSDSKLAFRFKVVNPMEGHGAPTGFDAERLMFLEVTVTDARGRVLLRSGDRDPNGDVRDLHSFYVHHQAAKEGDWLNRTAWKDEAGLPRNRQDRFWLPDPHLFSLQTKFITRNAFGGEREQIVPINISVDPLPYIRPEPFPTHLTGRPAGARKHLKVLPPGRHRWADYHLDSDELTPARPYRIRVRFIAQMVPVNLIKTISPVGFDFDLSPHEVAKRVVHGHPTTPDRRDSRRRGGAVTLWNYSIPVPPPGEERTVFLSPTEAQIARVPVSDYPFPHTTEDDLKRFQEELQRATVGSDGDLEKLQFRPPGAILWPDGVPDGISLLPPDEPEEEEESPDAPTSSEPPVPDANEEAGSPSPPSPDPPDLDSSVPNPSTSTLPTA